MLIAELDIQPVLRKIGGVRNKRAIKANGQKYEVNLGIRKLQLIAKTQECACCGLKGSFFKLETMSKGQDYPCLNLYGIGPRNNHIRFTLDHIFPRSKGGTTRWENVQLLCEKCNCAKGADIITLKELRQRISPKIPKEL